MAPVSQRSRCSAHSPEELARFLSGHLPPRRTRDLLRHLSGCSVCQERLRELGAVRDLLHRAPLPRAPRSFTLAPADVPLRPRRLWYPFLRGLTTTLAAIVLFLLAFTWLLPAALEPLVPPGLPDSSAEQPSSAPYTAPSTIVGPAITRRSPPTVGLGLVTPLPAYRTDTAYPRPVEALTPESTAGLSAIPGSPEKPADTPGPSFVTLLRLGGLLFLGLVAGLTYLAYRRERIFLR